MSCVGELPVQPEGTRSKGSGRGFAGQALKEGIGFVAGRSSSVSLPAGRIVVAAKCRVAPAPARDQGGRRPDQQEPSSQLR